VLYADHVLDGFEHIEKKFELDIQKMILRGIRISELFNQLNMGRRKLLDSKR